MSIHGFLDQNGQVQKYDYNDLDNKPTIPTQVVIDNTFTQQGQAADAKAVGDALDNITIPVDSTLTQQGAAADAKAVGDALQNSGGLSAAAKQALLNIFQHVAYVDENGQTYYDALETALNGGTTFIVTLNLTNCESSNASTSIIEGRTYSTILTASPGYSMDEAIVSATMGGEVVTGFYNNGTINIPNVTGDIVITATATSSVASISAAFSLGTDTPVDISSLSIIGGYINNPDGNWTADAGYSTICIPVTIGKRYSLSWASTDSSVVGNRSRWGFSNTNTPDGSVLSNFVIATPQNMPNGVTAPADRAYLVIQLAYDYASSILSNGYLSVTELADVVYTNDNLDTLRQYLTVTATYSDSTTAIVSDYALIGTLAEGTQTITASYGGKTDTFNVACTVDGFLYHFEQSLASSGTKDFGWSGPAYYDEGPGGTGYSYNHKIDPNDGDLGSIKVLNPTAAQKPDLSGDFTISAWFASPDTSSVFNAYIISSIYYNTSASATNVSNIISSVSTSGGWTADTSGLTSARYKGLRFQTNTSRLMVSMFSADENTRCSVMLTPPSGFDYAAWHHYALTRKSGKVRVFIDGSIICSFTYNKAVYVNNQITTCAAFRADENNPSDLVTFAYNTYIDDLFVSDYCKWTSEFSTSSIVY